MKFLKIWMGCKAGDIYPTRFQPGDDCPEELQSAAIEDGVVSVDGEAEEAPKVRRARKTKD